MSKIESDEIPDEIRLKIALAAAYMATHPFGGLTTDPPYAVEDFRRKSDILISPALTDGGQCTMNQAKRFFDKFRGGLFDFPGTVRSIIIQVLDEDLPNSSFAAGFLYPETLDEMYARNELFEPVGAICFECGNALPTPRITTKPMDEFLRLCAMGSDSGHRGMDTCSIHGLPNGKDGYCRRCEEDPDISIRTCVRCRRTYALYVTTNSVGLCAWCSERMLCAMRSVEKPPSPTAKKGFLKRLFGGSKSSA